MPTEPTLQPLPLTVLLNRMLHGDRQAGDQAIALVHTELGRIASREMRQEGPGHLLQTSALVNEAYLALVRSGSLQVNNRGHFFAIASRQMRNILTEQARIERAQKRGGGAIHVGLEEAGPSAKTWSFEELISLDAALDGLERIEPRAAKVIELRYFGGYTDAEVAEALGVSLAAVRRDWEFARAWLFDRLK